MQLYHGTTEEAADSILQTGFVDGSGLVGHPEVSNGVWFADIESPYGESQVCIDVPPEIAEQYKLIHEEAGCPGGDYNEFLLPAHIANTFIACRVED